MAEKTDRDLGMGRAIKRREFVQGAAVALAAGSAPMGRGALGAGPGESPVLESFYPPTRTGMRGSHPGSFETAHALAQASATFDPPAPVSKAYDLVIVGGGISGLTAAYYHCSIVRRIKGLD